MGDEPCPGISIPVYGENSSSILYCECPPDFTGVESFYLYSSNCTVGVETILGKGGVIAIQSILSVVFVALLLPVLKLLAQSIKEERCGDHPTRQWSYRSRCLLALSLALATRLLCFINITGEKFDGELADKIIHQLPFLFIIYYLAEMASAWISIAMLQKQRMLASVAQLGTLLKVTVVIILAIMVTALIMQNLSARGSKADSAWGLIYLLAFFVYMFGMMLVIHKKGSEVVRFLISNAQTGTISMRQVEMMKNFYRDARKIAVLIFVYFLSFLLFPLLCPKDEDLGAQEWNVSEACMIGAFFQVRVISACVEFLIALRVYWYFRIVSSGSAQAARMKPPVQRLQSALSSVSQAAREKLRRSRSKSSTAGTRSSRALSTKSTKSTRSFRTEGGDSYKSCTDQIIVENGYDDYAEAGSSQTLKSEVEFASAGTGSLRLSTESPRTVDGEGGTIASPSPRTSLSPTTPSRRGERRKTETPKSVEFTIHDLSGNY